MKSKKFYDDFVSYVENNFIDDYSATIEFKISKVLDKCLASVENKKGYQDIKEYIELNSKCKLPWSRHELEKAKDTVLALLKDKLRESHPTN